MGCGPCVDSTANRNEHLLTCLKTTPVQKLKSEPLLQLTYDQQSCHVSLRGAASRRLPLGCGWHLRLAGERFAGRADRSPTMYSMLEEGRKGKAADTHVQPGHRHCDSPSSPVQRPGAFPKSRIRSSRYFRKDPNTEKKKEDDRSPINK